MRTTISKAICKTISKTISKTIKTICKTISKTIKTIKRQTRNVLPGPSSVTITTLLTKTTVTQNKDALSYYRVRGLYFLAVIFVRSFFLNKYKYRLNQKCFCHHSRDIETEIAELCEAINIYEQKPQLNEKMS